MGEYAIKAALEATCPPDDVARWLTSSEGIVGWWSDSMSGSAARKGDVFHVRFPTTDIVFELEVTDIADDVVEWHVPESPPWWRGTTIRFELGAANGAGTSMLFTHTGFEPDDPVIAVVTPAWVRFLDNLIEVAQTGDANPAVMN